jgi:hypothetical protein
MPNLQEALDADLSAYTRVENIAQTNAPTPSTDLQPGRSSMMRCPLPLLSSATPDALRSFYINGQVPQVRLLAQQPVTLGSSASSSTTLVSSSSSSSSSTTATLAVATATTTTPTIGPNVKYTGVITLSKALQLLSVAVNSPARIQLYGTSTAQSSDLSRGLDAAPAAGTIQNIICDVVLDTAQYKWTFQDRIASNGDSPQSAAIYVTITNLDATSDAITMTMNYVPIVA